MKISMNRNVISMLVITVISVSIAAWILSSPAEVHGSDASHDSHDHAEVHEHGDEAEDAPRGPNGVDY